MNYKTLGIDIGSTTVKIAILDENENLIFADYKRHFANIQETLADLLQEAFDQYGEMTDHRFRRSDPCQPSGRSFYPGGYCSFYFSAEAGTKDRCCHRAWR